jgi:diacylglycerol kinase family enzyme
MAGHCYRPVTYGARPRLAPATVDGLVRLLMVVNSFASSVTARTTVVVHQVLSQEHDVQIVETSRRGHATRFAQDAASRGVDVVVAFGGDGTVNEVAAGIAETNTALAVLPGGSTNVFARSIGLPNDPIAAAKQLVPALKEHSFRRVGLGMVNGRYFCFHTGVGYDAAVVREVEKRASVKRWMGHPLFIYAALRTWFSKYDRKHPHFVVDLPDVDTVVPDGYFTVVLNSSPYTYLGNRALDLSPYATMERGLVAITFRSLRARPFLAAITRTLRGRPIETSATVDEHHDVTRLDIESPRPFPYQVDGDYLGETRRLRFQHRPSVMELVLPLN